MDKPKINIVGTIFGITGYDNHTRELANALNKIADVRISTNMVQNWERMVNDEELKMIKKNFEEDINLIITHPSNWKMNLSNSRNWVYLVWEGDKVPTWIAQECVNQDIEKIIVPSNHTYEALENTEYVRQNPEIMGKVNIVPHGVNLDRFYPEPRKDETFRFVANKGLRNIEDRGGIQYLIKSYLEEFSDKDNVELLLKVNPAYGVPNLLEMFPELKNKGTPKIIFNHNALPPENMKEVYNLGDIFVSPTRAEAFNLPCLEALACGKPVITSSYGGQTDFIDDKTGFLIGGELKEVEHELEYEGVKWLTPNQKELKIMMRWAYENKEVLKKMEQECLNRARELTWDNTADKIINLIKTEKFK